MTPVPVQPGDLVACRLAGSPAVVLGIVGAVTDAAPAGWPGRGLADESASGWPALVLRFPAELRSQAFMAVNQLTRQPELRVVPLLFFLALPVESFAWAELASVHVLRDDDLDTRFDYARGVLADYRANVARWNADAVRIPVRRVEAG